MFVATPAEEAVADGSINQQNAAGMEASFLVSLEIAKKKKPHTIEEQLIVPGAKIMVKLVLGEKSAEKLCYFPFERYCPQLNMSAFSGYQRTGDTGNKKCWFVQHPNR